MEEVCPMVDAVPLRSLVGDKADDCFLLGAFQFDDSAERLLHRDAFAAELVAQAKEEPSKALLYSGWYICPHSISSGTQ